MGKKLFGSNMNPSNRSITELLELVLKRNNIQFNRANYLQIGATAMGTKLAPSYVNLFMENLEKKLLETHNQKPDVWWRFLADIFYVWNYGPEELERWLQHLNNFHDTVKFTMENSRTEV